MQYSKKGCIVQFWQYVLMKLFKRQFQSLFILNSISVYRIFISSRFYNAIWLNMQFDIPQRFCFDNTCNWRRTHWLLWGPDILIISWHLFFIEDSLQRIEAILSRAEMGNLTGFIFFPNWQWKGQQLSRSMRPAS